MLQTQLTIAQHYICISKHLRQRHSHQSIQIRTLPESMTDEEPSKDEQPIVDTASEVTSVPDLSPGQPQLHSTPATPKFESCDGSRRVENKVSSVAAKFSSLSEALNSKIPTNVNVIGGGITRVQKVRLFFSIICCGYVILSNVSDAVAKSMNHY